MMTETLTGRLGKLTVEALRRSDFQSSEPAADQSAVQMSRQKLDSQGENPDELPIRKGAKVELFVNFKTANALDITVPVPLLGRTR